MPGQRRRRRYRGGRREQGHLHPDHTADWFTFTTTKVGTITVLNDQTTLSLRSNGRITRALINVRSVKLTPVAEDKK